MELLFFVFFWGGGCQWSEIKHFKKIQLRPKDMVIHDALNHRLPAYTCQMPNSDNNNKLTKKKR